METQKERVLLIESDPQISHLIAKQALQPLGYHVEVIESANSVIQEVGKIAPDVIIINLNLPEMNGKDLLVALVSQGINVPIIVIATKGQETDILQAFRLGAVDFLICPIRETEVINVIENTLNKQRARYDLEVYAHQLDHNKEVIARQVGDFSEIFSLTKLVSLNVNQQYLYDKIASKAVLVSEADSAWILSFDAKQKNFILRTCLNASEEMVSKLNLPYEDGLSSLITVSGQVVSIHGEALKRYSNPALMESALLVPIKCKDEITGILAVARKTPQPFNNSQQAMLELVAEYASILLENSRRFHLMEQRLIYLQQADIYATIESHLKNDLLRQASLELRNPLNFLMESVDLLLNKGDRRLSREQMLALNNIREEAGILLDISDSMVRIRQGETSRLLEDIDLNEVVRDMVNRFQPLAQVGQIIIKLELPEQPTLVKVYLSQIAKVIEGLLSNALKYSQPRGLITIHIDQKEDNTIVEVDNQGDGIDERLVERMFDNKSSIYGDTARRFGGIGISLPMIKEIISAYKGQIWIDSKQGKGFSISFTVPRR
ncbi:MAG: ATP-binding protein [Anaerolineales bacterium]